MPTISVLMPAYNAARYVAEAVESILAQTYGDFEFLIVDDGSTDRTGRILESYARRDARIRLLSRPNRGMVPSLNELLSLAQGEFLARMDADDVALPARFALQVDYLRRHPEVVCLGGSQVNVDAHGWTLYEDRVTLTEHEQIEASIFAGMNPISHPTTMLRSDAVRSVGGYRVEMERAEDVDLWLRLGERGRLAMLSETVLKYRYHDQSVSARNRHLLRGAYLSACNEAFDRRGLERKPIDIMPWRQEDGDGRFRWVVNFGWAGHMRGDSRMAFYYGARALRMNPLRRDGWWLLACAALRPGGKARAADQAF